MHDPIARFLEWFAEARAHETHDPTAMCLSTVAADGAPSSRMVLLKQADARGFVFYTNLDSRKGEELRQDARVALCLHWPRLERQVRVEGRAEAVSPDEADAYFASRERLSQIGAWASEQSRPLPGRFELEKRVALYTARFGLGPVPRPPHWSGFRVVPHAIELWRQLPFRLHERERYERSGDTWSCQALFP